MPRYAKSSELFRPEHKVCAICSATFYRPKGKSDKVWENQVCCSKSCSAILRRKEDAPERNLKRRKNLKPGGNAYKGGKRIEMQA